MKIFIILLALVPAFGRMPMPKSKIITEGKYKIEVLSLKNNFELLGLPPKFQGSRGTCGSFAVTAALEYEWAKQNLKNRGTRFSENYLVWAKQKRESFGKKQDASVIEELIHAVKYYGICREELFPYDFHNTVVKDPPNSVIWEAKQRTGFQEFWITGYKKVIGDSKKFWIEYRDSAIGKYSFMPLEKLENSLFEAVYFDY